MKFADRLKVTASGMSSTTLSVNTTITMGVAATGCRTLLQAINAGEIAVGDINIPFIVEDAAGHWQSSYFTITSNTVITCTQIINSSNNGLPVTFSNATPSVFNSAPASLLNAGLINPHDPGFDIILCAGQSNMQGQMSPDSTIDVTDPRVYAWGGCPTDPGTYQKIALAADPLKHYTIAPGMGPATWFAKTYAGMIPANRKILLVPVAKGATYLVAQTAEWSPGDGTSNGIVASGYLYENAIAQANAALAAAQLLYPNSRFVGTIWLQGESDADYTVSQTRYSSGLKTLIQGFRNRITGASNSWFLIAGMIGEYVANIPGNKAGYGPIDLAHQQVANEIAKCAYFPGVTGYQFSPSNTVHYNTTGARIMGCGLGSVYGKALTNKGVDITSPVILSASVANTSPTKVSIILSEPFDPAYPPQVSSYTVSGHAVTGASGNGNVVYLTVAPGFVNGEATRSIIFTPTGSDIRDFSGNPMGAQSGITITNNVSAVANAITLSGPTSGTAGQTSTQFSVGVSPVGGTITGTVTATPSDGGAGGTFNPTSLPLTTGAATGTFTYTPSSSASGNVIISITNDGSLTNPQTITYNVTAAVADTQPPTFVSAQVANTQPSDVQITMSEALLTTSIPPTSAFTITENGASKTLSNVNISGTIVTVTCSTPFSSGTSILLTYTAPASDPRIQDASHNPTTTFSGVTVTNNVASGGNTPLRFTTLTNMTETSSTAPYAYAENSSYTNYAANNNGAVSQLALAGDGVFITQLGGVSGQPMVGFRINQTVGTYSSIPYDMMAKTTGYAAYQGTATTVVSNRIPANGDWLKFVRTGSNIQFYVSTNQQDWTLIFTWTGVVAGSLWCQILSVYPGTYTAPQGTGWA